MKIIVDTHLHSNHSHDAFDALSSICEAAIHKGLKVLCTTEHLFLDPRDVGYGYFNLENYLAVVKACQETFKGRLEVLSGVEFSETHLFPNELKRLVAQPVDMIVGALHWLDVGFFGDPEVLAKVNHQDLVQAYYDRLLDMVEVGGFDTLAHMDLIKRYIPSDEQIVTQAMKEVLQSLVNNKIALELNTSTIYKDQLETAAAFTLVDTYLELGGRRLTVGSDAHKLENIARGFDTIPERFHPYIGYFRKREFIAMVDE